MVSILDSVGRKRFIGKYIWRPRSPLYRYKECPTPEIYSGQQTIQAFSLGYIRGCGAISLQHNIQVTDDIGVEFSTSNLPPEAKPGEMIGWYFCHKDLVNFDWGNLKPGIETEGQLKLEQKEKFRWVREKEGHIGGINRLWVIRGYFIGPDEKNAPPCITVLCAYEDVARFLVDFIHSRLHLHKGWGATKLPGVSVLKFVSCGENNDHLDNSEDSSNPGTSSHDPPVENVDREAEDYLIRIDIGSANNHPVPVMTNGDLFSWADNCHRCGTQVEIIKDSQVIAKATVGGLVKVGNEVYGLTVGHLFSPSATHDDEVYQRLSTWQEWEGCNMELDWALVRMPGLQERDVDSWMDVNLVRTVSGHCRPVLIALEEPYPYTHVVIATPGMTTCLRGVFVGPGAILNIPESPTPYAAWVCRMEEPWLIQPGDSGSWVLDAENSMLLGVLVAGCPDLQEAYIIPAHEIIDDIGRHYPDNMSVNLPNCHPLPRPTQIDLKRHIDEYGRIVKSCESLHSLQGLEELGSRISKWVEESEAFVDISSSLYNLRDEISQWISALAVPQYNTNVLWNKPWDYDLTRSTEVRLKNEKSRNYSGFQSLWEKDSIAKPFQGYGYRCRFPWADHASEHLFQEPSLNKADWYISKSRGDDLFDKAARQRTALPPWDRLTCNRVFNKLRGDLQALIAIQKRGFELSLPETKSSGSPFVSQKLQPDSNSMLFAVKLTKKDNRFLVVLPPPSVGPSKSIQPWPSARDYPAYARSNRHIAFSAWRLPFMLTDKSTPEEECLELLLSTQLNIDIGALKQRRKLDLRDEHSRFYLKEYNKYVDVVIYEGHVEDQSFVSPQMIHGPTGWMMQMMDEASARKHLSPPFSAILYPPIPDE